MTMTNQERVEVTLRRHGSLPKSSIQTNAKLSAIEADNALKHFIYGTCEVKKIGKYYHWIGSTSRLLSAQVWNGNLNLSCTNCQVVTIL